MNFKYSFYLFTMMGCILIAGCSNDTKTTTPTVTTVKKPVVMEPFRYHKLIEVSPGQDYDVLSWGRGSTKTGAFEILHSDSAGAKFTTTTGDLVGNIVDVYNSDMDLDGNPEILIQATGKDTINYTNIYAFEFGNSKVNKLDFPKLNKSQRAGYRGDDNFYIKDGALIREFPIYDGTGKTAKPTGQKRQLQYGLRDNEFTVKQLSKDSTSTKKPIADKVVKASTTTKSESTPKKTKKHHEEKHKKKHRKHRRHSDEDEG
ncbi:hypothetical protein [Mucilaginibacter sp.]|uniref:hypothetical protein n=1 Tax=Mucilaginibacter sp. TaxID=1882438 RepID=UPI003D0E3FA6